MKAGNADKGLVLRGHSLSSKKRRLCVCTYHKARGIFDVWRKWIVERPVDILTKSFPFLKKLLRLLLRTVPSFRCENIPQCPGRSLHWLDHTNILYSPGEISTVCRVQLALYYIKAEFNPSAHLVWGPRPKKSPPAKSTPAPLATFFEAYSHKKKKNFISLRQCSLNSSGDLISMLQ